MAQGEAPAGATAPGPPTQEGQTPEQAGADSARPAQEDLPDLEALLERYDPDLLRKNRKIMGIAGGLADRLATQRAETLAQQRAEALYQQRRERDEAERSRQSMLSTARKGDFYALGEQSAKQLLVEDQQRFVDRYRQQAAVDAYGNVQRVVDEIAGGFDPAVVATAAERMGEVPADARWEDGLKRWLPALVQAQAEHLAGRPEARQKVEHEITPAVRARLLAEMNGTEPAADSGTGRAPAQRTLTDEQIAEMGPEEWVQVYDVKAGKFKPGVVYKPTRAVDPRAMQIVGRAT